ncbi:MAG: hypothetical protein MJ223_03035 [Mycoplasmoidaceae bacterium]|nr:hypothetical protein [Mycoplasmoidaceae bacterium]
MKTAVGKFKNNDNAKYFFPWQFIMVAVAMFVLFSISNIVAQKDNS